MLSSTSFEVSKIGDGFRVTVPLDTETPASAGAFSRVFDGYLRQPNGSLKRVATKIMRSDCSLDIGGKVFSEEVLILDCLENTRGIMKLLESGFLRVWNKIDDSINNFYDIQGNVLRIDNQYLDHFINLMPDYLEDGWLPYISVERVPRYFLNLQSMIDAKQKRGQRIDLSEGLKIAISACDLLDAVHSKGVIYRDHKPTHWFWDEHEELIYFIDWNVSLFLSPNNLTEKLIIADVIGFSKILFFLFTGRTISPALEIEFVTSKTHQRHAGLWKYDDEWLPMELKKVIADGLTGKYNDILSLRSALQATITL